MLFPWTKKGSQQFINNHNHQPLVIIDNMLKLNAELGFILQKQGSVRGVPRGVNTIQGILSSIRDKLNVGTET